MNDNPAFHRVRLLTGADALARLRDIRVVIFGLGGVGSWCAEALVRSGIRNLTIVDSDVICVTNINRQVQATTASIGKSKASELQARLLAINPEASVKAVHEVFDKKNADRFDLKAYDYVIDAIDSLSSKVELIIRASQAGTRIFSALGASNKMDPTRIKVSSLWESQGCPLGRFVRKRLRRRKFNGEVTCIYSDEDLQPRAEAGDCGTGICHCPPAAQSGSALDTGSVSQEWCSKKKQINGSAVHITGTFGFMLAGLVIQDVCRNSFKQS